MENKKILAFIYDGRKFLALRNNSKDLSHGGDFWFTVTGSLEKGEREEDAVKREVKEETDLNARYIFDLNLGSVYNWKDKNYWEENFIVFVKKRKIKLNEEHTEHKWLNLNKFADLIDWRGNKEELKTILKSGIKKEQVFPFIRLDDYISRDALKTTFLDGKDKTILSWHESDNFSKMKDVKQCYGICFDRKGRIMIISEKKDKWSLPGGTPEKGETFEETLKREVNEEADIKIDNIIPIGYNKIEQTKKGKTSIFYQLRYIADITKINRQTIDPATNTILKRKFIKPEEFVSYSLWGRPGGAMIEKALEKHGK